MSKKPCKVLYLLAGQPYQVEVGQEKGNSGGLMYVRRWIGGWQREVEKIRERCAWVMMMSYEMLEYEKKTIIC